MSEIRWIPGSENLFLAAHMDGSLIVYDKEKEDAPFEAEANGYHANGDSEKNGSSDDHQAKIHVDKSVNSANQKFNPVSYWKLSNQRINAYAFSPDNRHLAVVSEDGTLRIIDYLKEEYVLSSPIRKANTDSSDYLICTLVTMADSSVYVGHQMANM